MMSRSSFAPHGQRILLIDDDFQSLESTRRILEVAGYSVETAENGQVGLRKVKDSQRGAVPFAACLSDVRMPQMGGIDFLRAISSEYPDLPVLLMTAFGTVEDAVQAMKLGAVDFLSKPFNRTTLLSTLEQVVERSRLRAKRGVRKDAAENQWIGDSFPFQRLKIELEQVASVGSTVLIRGESGTGKEKVARLIHEKSDRAQGPWIALNCAALPENLIESELFGHEKGAFTGAQHSHAGLFEAADGGTLFLDEMGDMPLPLQSRLLRVLQEGEVRPLGSTQSKKVNVRVIAATHRDLHEAVRQGRFRQDLLFRLEVLTLDVPALRNREGDLLLLAEHFVKTFGERHGRQDCAMSISFQEALLKHPWPGNVRELQNVIERAVVFSTSGEELTLQHLPSHLVPASSVSHPDEVSSLGQVGDSTSASWIPVKIGTPLREVEDLLIRKTLEATEGDKTATAQLLGINARTIYRKIEKWEDGNVSQAEPELDPSAKVDSVSL